MSESFLRSPTPLTPSIPSKSTVLVLQMVKRSYMFVGSKGFAVGARGRNEALMSAMLLGLVKP